MLSPASVGYVWFLLALGVSSAALAGVDAAYARRGDYWEGVKAREVGGAGLALIAAQAKWRGQATADPENLHIRFFLGQSQKVALQVCERQNEHFYWLDKVRLGQNWPQGFANEFTWPTAPVIRRLHLSLADLAVVARLRGDKPTDEEAIAPVLLYADSPPTEIEGYVFSFHLGATAQLQWQIYRTDASQPLASGRLGLKQADEVFDVYWQTTGQAAGDYRLVLNGKRRADSLPVTQTVHFHHQPL